MQTSGRGSIALISLGLVYLNSGNKLREGGCLSSEVVLMG